MSNPDHEDLSVRVIQGMTLGTVLQIVLMLGALAAVYAKMTANDEKLFLAQEQFKVDVARIDRERELLRSDIRSDLRDIKEEIKQLRTDLAKTK